MRNREDPQLLRCDQIRDAVGEARDGELADREAGRHAGNRDSGVRPGRKLLDGPVNCSEERESETRSLSLVPECGLLQLG